METNYNSVDRESPSAHQAGLLIRGNSKLLAVMVC